MLVREIMNPKPVVIAPEMSVPDALSLMRERKIHQLPVLDKHGQLVGILTEQDLLHASASSVTSLSVWEIPTLLAKITVAIGEGKTIPPTGKAFKIGMATIGHWTKASWTRNTFSGTT